MSAGSRIDAAAVMNTPAVMHAAASPHPNDGPQSAPPRPPLPRPAAQPATASSPLPGPVTSPGEGDLPARFFFRAARNGVGATANLVNLSNDSLDITVTAVSGETHMRSVVEVSVLPHQRKNLLLEGLQVELGDQVTLHSPPFPDQNFAAQ